MADNTFLGLQPYTEDDAYRFKGRTEESRELFRLIVRNDFTVCYAESGEGKTSLLNAGVFPLLRENMYFPIAITFTSDDYKVTPESFDTIIDRCIRDSITAYNEKNKGVKVKYKLCSTDFQGLDSQDELQQELSKHSWWKLRNYKPQAMGLTFIPVFVFDQFEEVFNLPGSIVWTKKFFDWLEDVSSDSCPDEIVKKVRRIIGDKAAFPTINEEKVFKAVFSLRKELIGELDYWGMQTHFIPALKDNRYCLKALTYDGAKKVMTQQEAFEEDMVEKVLKYFVSKYSREHVLTIAENLPVIPALLLSVVCDSWERDINTFSIHASSEIDKSLRKILERFYNQAIETILKEISQQEINNDKNSCKKDLDTIAIALIDGNGKRVRRKITSSRLKDVNFDAKYKKILSENRIIKITRIDGEDYVELVHDSLCPIISKIKEQRLAEETRKRNEQKIKEQNLKIKRRKRIILFLVISVFIIITGATYIISRLNEQQRLMMESQSRYVAEKAMAIVDEGDSYTARLLALNVLPNSDNPGWPYTIEAENALRKANTYNNAILTGHSSSVNTVCFSPDDRYIVSASEDSTIRIWDASTGHCIHILTGHSNAVSTASFSPNGKSIISASSDNTIRIWNAASGQQIKTIKDCGKGILSASFSPNGKQIITSSIDNSLRIWDVSTGQCVKTLNGHKDWVSFASFSPDGTRIVSASHDYTIRIWDVYSGQCIQTLEGHSDWVNTASYNSSGRYIVSASLDNTIRIWDSYTGFCLKTLTGHTDGVHSAYFNPNGNRIISTSLDQTIRIWNISTGKIIQTLDGHNSSLNCATYSNNGLRIVSSSLDNEIRIWDATQDSQGHTGAVSHVAFSSDGERIVTSSYDHNICIWNTKTGLCTQKFEGHTDAVSCVSFSPNNQYIVSASLDKTIRVWDVVLGYCLHTLQGHSGGVRFVSYSPDGKYIVSSSMDNTIRIWNSEIGQCVKIITGHTKIINSVFYSPNGKQIVSASADNTIRIWDPLSGICKRILRGHLDAVTYASFSPDGKYIVSASEDQTIRIWDVSSGQCIQLLKGHNDIVTSVSFSPNGELIVSSSADKTVCVWKAFKKLESPSQENFTDSISKTTQIGPIRCLEKHNDVVTFASFSPDNHNIVSTSVDNTISIWDLKKRNEVNDEYVRQLGGPCETNNTLSLQQLIDKTRERFKDRRLTSEERRKYYLE